MIEILFQMMHPIVTMICFFVFIYIIVVLGLSYITNRREVESLKFQVQCMHEHSVVDLEKYK